VCSSDLTDIHLNFVPESRLDALCRAIREAGADAVLLGGDIGEAPDVEGHLEGPDDRLGLPGYLTLGDPSGGYCRATRIRRHRPRGAAW